jgi:hydroxymethylpyrimidine pyrophosphatase-like HAD family hydrolase
MAAFPRDVGVMIIGDDMRLYQHGGSEQLKGLFNDELSDYFLRPLEEMPTGWNKVLFAAQPDVLKKVERFVAQRSYPGVYFVSTNAVYFEMMPQGVSKGSAVHDLCELLGVAVENTYAIGDYYNDMEIMQQAGYAVAMANAPSEVRALAHELTGTNDEGGVGQFLYKMVQKYGGA